VLKHLSTPSRATDDCNSKCMHVRKDSPPEADVSSAQNPQPEGFRALETIALLLAFLIFMSLLLNSEFVHVRRDSNPQPAVLETAALPIELLTYFIFRIITWFPYATYVCDKSGNIFYTRFCRSVFFYSLSWCNFDVCKQCIRV
jgi:hypothetical protein